MPPRRWTALFFLDEAVALAAGHRPCGECRRADYLRFAEAWEAGFGPWRGPEAADAKLHRARALPGARHLRQETGTARTLPDGSFVSQAGRAYLLSEGQALAYTPKGYCPPQAVPTGPVMILTNPVLRAVLAGGYRPGRHPSAVRPASLPS
jgi:hypothetical protein